ncbi:VCBS domain-containing protein [Pseudovibrio sp. Ad37]|uniref:VCBS domain-containing protein n=1 Tax=Pseudovibrio sp. Ad37 TaxID=989422 RepID=UPI0007AE6B5B|nr:VCBS domain-containing protein [Pseudovibrio sp. Ad37]KZL15134.1 Endo-1,3-1,4-beta-glycanase ExsH [Pseudovibrio sp. Ad37]
MPNTAPISYPVQMNTNENGVIAIRVIFQDADLLDTHTLTLNTDEMIGTGTVMSDYKFHYDPGTAFDYLKAGETATDTFSYTITDSAGESTTSTVTLTITGQNDAPVAAALEQQTDERTAIVIAPEFTDQDASDSHGVTIDTTGTVGSVTLNADGTFSYDPDGKFDHLNAGETATDTFTYTVTDAAGDSSTETVTVTVTGMDPNTAPVTFPFAFSAKEDGKIIFRAIYHDPDAGDSHTWTVNTDGLKGTLTETESGVFDYVPGAALDYLAEGETELETFTYTVTDSFGASHTSTITITVTGENDGPIASAMNVSTSESSSLVITPDFMDPDTNDTHTITVQTSTTKGTVTINEDGTFTYDTNGAFDDLDRNESAIDTFSYTVEDEAGATSSETVTVTVNGESKALIQPVKIIASDGAAQDYFGHSAQINDHGTIVVGAFGDDVKGDLSGSAYVYTPDEEGGLSETKLQAYRGSAGDLFGSSTAINNSGIMAISAYKDDDMGEDSGSVYVVTPIGETGFKQLKLTASDGRKEDFLGRTLAINDDGVIVASAFGNSKNRIVIFTPDEMGEYSQISLPIRGIPNFGYPYDIGVQVNDEGVITVGGRGRLSIFTEDGEGGYREQVFKDPDMSNNFGGRVVVESDGSFVVGGTDAIFVYKPDGEGNYSISKFEDDTARSLAMNSKGVIAIGQHSSGKKEFVTVYVPDGPNAYTRYDLSPINGEEFDGYTTCVSIAADGTIIVGEDHDDDKAYDAGAVYIFTQNADGSYTGPDGTVFEAQGTVETGYVGLSPVEIRGSEASETLQGGDLADRLLGNGGDDTIDGGMGDDSIYGGEGNDTFVFNSGDTGHDLIGDFAAGSGPSDVIRFEASLFSDFDAVLAAAAQSGANTMITIAEGTSVTLGGVTLSDLHQDDFAFV